MLLVDASGQYSWLMATSGHCVLDARLSVAHRSVSAREHHQHIHGHVMVPAAAVLVTAALVALRAPLVGFSSFWRVLALFGTSARCTRKTPKKPKWVRVAQLVLLLVAAGTSAR